MAEPLRIGVFPLTRGVGAAELNDFQSLLPAQRFRLIRHAAATETTASLSIGSDAERAAALHGFIEAEQLDVLIAARGGYGCVRLLPHLAFDRLPAHLTIVGYSDVTALHLALLGRRWAESTLPDRVPAPKPRLIHGAMPVDLGHAPLAAFKRLAVQRLIACLDEDRPALPGPADLGSARVIRPGTAKGPVIAVNLSILASLVGTSWLGDRPGLFRGAVLAIEEVGEAAYRVDRMLQQLRHAGVLEGLAALLVGDMDKAEDGAEVFIADAEGRPRFARGLAEMLLDAAAPGYPIITGWPIGHGRHNLPHQQGLAVTLDVSAAAVRIAPAV